MGRRRQPKRISEQVNLEVTRLSHDGRGIAERDGKTVFIRGALPGEKVVAEIQFKKSRYEEGRVDEIIKAADDRIEPRCPHTDRCGGCSLQHLDPEAQIAFKQTVLMDQFKHFGSIEPDQIIPPMTGPVYGYRHKARLGVRYVTKRDEVLVGFREQGNSFIADIESCAILNPQVGEKLMQLRQLVKSLSNYKQLPQIEVAIGEDATVLIFRHLEPFEESDIEQLVEFGKLQGMHIYLQPGGMDTVHRLWPENPNGAAGERLSYWLPDFDLEFRFHPQDFTQVNPDINRMMVSRALELLDPQPEEQVLDLFCGLGNFTLPLARSGAQVTGVEGSSAMVERGYENASLNNLDNVRFFAMDLTQDASQETWAQQSYDKVLIDPPRSGALEMIEPIVSFNPSRIVYVSCNPATLARDAGELQKHGYRLEQAGVMDMFPHTTHVESIALFVKG